MQTLPALHHHQLPYPHTFLALVTRSFVAQSHIVSGGGKACAPCSTQSSIGNLLPCNGSFVSQNNIDCTQQRCMGAHWYCSFQRPSGAHGRRDSRYVQPQGQVTQYASSEGMYCLGCSHVIAILASCSQVATAAGLLECRSTRGSCSSGSSRSARLIQAAQASVRLCGSVSAARYHAGAAASSRLSSYFGHNTGCVQEVEYLYTKLVMPYSTVSDATGSEDLRLCSQPGAVAAFSMSKLPVFKMSVRGTCCKARPGKL